MSILSQWFWNERFWLPPGATWKSIESNAFERYPDISDLAYALVFAPLLIAVRFLLEWTAARPIGRLLGVPDHYVEQPDFFKVVARALGLEKKPTNFGKSDLSSGCQNGKASVVALPQKSRLDKFSECLHQLTRVRMLTRTITRNPVNPTPTLCSRLKWRGSYYTFVFVFGVRLIHSKGWFSNTAQCWHGWPFQTIDSDIWWFYIGQCSFYCSLTISQFFDVQRKDFWINFIHHIATILLISFSWVCNFIRIGILTLVIHDAADPWIELIKMTRYCGFTNVCNTCFAIFTIVWIITRLGFFPMKILYSSLVEAVSLHGYSGALYVFIPLLLTLQVLHVIWTAMILRILKETLSEGEFNDVRSDDESD